MQGETLLTQVAPLPPQNGMGMVAVPAVSAGWGSSCIFKASLIYIGVPAYLGYGRDPFQKGVVVGQTLSSQPRTISSVCSSVNLQEISLCKTMRTPLFVDGMM